MTRNFDLLPVRKLKLDLSQARSIEKYVIDCTNIRVNASDNNALAHLRFNANTNSAINAFLGRRFKDFPIRVVYVDNEVQAGKWIELEYWKSEPGGPQIEDDALTATITGAVIIDDADPIDVEFSTDPQIQGITDPLTPQTFNTTDTPYLSSSSSTSLITVVTPAANTGGIIVKAMSSLPFAGYVRIMAKSSAPGSITDGDAFTLSHGYSYSGGGNSNAKHAVPLPLLIPAGLGLYHQYSGGSSFRVDMILEVL